jgi:signal transduction histidine kinase/CheY-like chemotaxis protein
MTAQLLDRILTVIRKQEAVPSLLVFGAYLASAKFARWIFFATHSSPAVIWPTPAIALAAVMLFGYRMWIPIALGQLVFALTSGISPVVSVVSTIAYTLQALIGAYILNRLGWDRALSRTRDTLIFMGLALLLPMTGPALVTSAQYLTHTLNDTWWVSWSRAWAGGVLSLMVVAPLLILWSARLPRMATRRQIAEFVSALVVLTGSVYIVFWTTLPQANVFLSLYLLFAILFWIGLRLGPRTMSLGLFIITAFGMLGSVIGHPSPTPLNVQLFADELFMVLIAPIFLILATVVEERRIAASKLHANVSELEDALHKLAIEDQSKNEFIATLAHELRNPLAPVMSTLEFLKLEDWKPDTHTMIERAEDQLHLMRRLLDDLLDVARITQKNFALQKEPVTLQSAIMRSVHTVDAFMRSRKHDLVVTLPSEPLWLYGDPVRLTQIFTNILFNAAKYTTMGGRIELAASSRDGEAMVTIADNGTGIEAERLERIFEAFVHTSPRTTVGTGLGIGLSLTKRLVEMHQGRIYAESQGAGKGSTFTVDLPLYANQPAASPGPAQTIDALQDRIAAPFRILVVDDNEAAAHGLEKLLTYKGYKVMLAYDGRSAVSAVPEISPDVILLDIGLPDIDGYEVARRVRQDGPAQASKSHPYLIALTGYGQDEDKTRAREAGFNYHLTKPVGLKEIESVLRTIASTPEERVA